MLVKGDQGVLSFDREHDVKEREPKATKAEFAYVESPTGNPHCGNCNMYLLGGGCTIVEGDIDPVNGVCSFWCYRRTKPPSGAKPEDEYTKESAGYLEHKGGARCGTCEYFSRPNRCKKVAGQVDGTHGCCMRWEAKDE